jgi:hypothetical protein
MKILLSVKSLTHSLGERPSGSLSKATHLYNLALTLEGPHLIENGLQRLDPAVINDFLEFL